MSAASTFHRELLQSTLSNAAQTPFYQQHWHSLDVNAVTLETLSQIPTVNKELVRRAGRDAQNRRGLVCNEVFTSGTTGVPLVTVRGDREQTFIYRFYSAALEQGSGARPRGLQFNNPYHGSHIAIPTPFHFHRVGLYDAGAFEHARGVLTSTHEDENVAPRVTTMVGLERCLRAFTADTSRRHPEGFPSALEVIVSYSQYLTPAWRARMERTFGCPVIDRFSLSEIFGGATQSPIDRYWRYDPVVIPEVIGSHDGLPVAEGLGILVLTALYPFQEAQPLVRYLTGDLVEVTHMGSSCVDELAFRPLGRARYGVPVPLTNAWLLTPADAYEVMDELVDIARVPRFVDSSEVRDPYAIGHPRYAISWRVDGSVVRVSMELEARRDASTDERSRLRAAARDGLMTRPALASAVAGNRASLDVTVTDNVRPDLIAHSS